MYIPIFIAILMGLLTPINQSAHKVNGTGYVKLDGSVPQASTLDTDSIPPGGDGEGETGIGGPGDGTGTGGGTGQNPPPKP